MLQRFDPRSLSPGPVLPGVLLAALALTAPAGAVPQDWAVQFGGGGLSQTWVTDSASDAAGGVFVVGRDAQTLDAFVSRRSGAGVELWMEWISTTSEDSAHGAAADGSGGVYVVGDTLGDLGAPGLGSTDAFCVRYAADGAVLWTRTYGTSDSDSARSVVADGAGGFFIFGATEGVMGASSSGGLDVWISRCDGNGNPLWIQQFGSSSTYDGAYDVTIDGTGGVYACGGSHGNFAGANAGLEDAWFARFNGSGSLLWARQLGSSENDRAVTILSDGSGGAFVAGFTHGTLGTSSLGFRDAFLAHYDGAGNPLWLSQLGSDKGDDIADLVLDGNGGVYFAGTSGGPFGGPQQAGDIWYGQIDSAGIPIFYRSMGSSEVERGVTLVGDGSGGLIVSGDTLGGVFGPNPPDPYGQDGFTARFDACDFGGTQSYCPGVPNSTGQAATLAHSGSVRVTKNDFTLAAAACPPNQLGLFIMAPQQGSTTFGNGVLCLSGGILRLQPVLALGTTGSASSTLDFTDPNSPASAISAGATWNFQLWYRDTAAGGAGFNLSGALSATFCP